MSASQEPVHTILVIDDEPTITSMLKRALEGAGYRVEVANDGEGGMAKIDEVKPSLVMCDIRMPGMDGFEILAKLRGRPDAEWIPLIMVTGMGEPDAVIKAHDLEADLYVTKPFNLAHLLKNVETILALAQLRRNQ